MKKVLLELILKRAICSAKTSKKSWVMFIWL